MATNVQISALPSVNDGTEVVVKPASCFASRKHFLLTICLRKTTNVSEVWRSKCPPFVNIYPRNWVSGIAEKYYYMLMQAQSIPYLRFVSYHKMKLYTYLKISSACWRKVTLNQGLPGHKPYGLTGEGSRSFHRQCGLVSYPTSLIAWAMVPCPRCHTSEISQPENQLPILTQSNLLDAVSVFAFGHLNYSFHPPSHGQGSSPPRWSNLAAWLLQADTAR